MNLLTDKRIIAGPAVNGSGLAIDLSTVAQGGAVIAEGYYADGVFYYFAMEAEGELLNPAVDFVSISRARCRDNNYIRV